LGTILFLQSAMAQELGGGVDKPGEWYVGEGLKKGDFFLIGFAMLITKNVKIFKWTFG